MSLPGVYDPDNIFAKMIRGEAPAVKVLETDTIFAFMDIFPQSRGHVLVISKTAQARNILDVEPQVLSTLMVEVQRVAKAIAAALTPDGIVVTQFNGAPAGQTVFHLHVHVIPCWTGQPLGRHGAAPMADVVELNHLAKAIAAHLPG